jgi:hypothetical protein
MFKRLMAVGVARLVDPYAQNALFLTMIIASGEKMRHLLFTKLKVWVGERPKTILQHLKSASNCWKERLRRYFRQRTQGTLQC